MRIFPTPRLTAAPIARLCGISENRDIETLAPIQLRKGDRLQLLQRLDRQAKWRTLDEKRHCSRCGAIFSGRQIDIVGGTRASGPLRPLCPSDQCRSTPELWTAPPGRQTVPVMERLRELNQPTTPNALLLEKKQRVDEGAVLRRFARWFLPVRSRA